jgi:hypothetical protein
VCLIKITFNENYNVKKQGAMAELVEYRVSDPGVCASKHSFGFLLWIGSK